MPKFKYNAEIKDKIAARVVGTLMPILAGAMLLQIVAILILRPEQWTRVIPGGIVCLWLIWVRWLIRKGHIRRAAHMFVALCVVGILSAMILNGGVQAPAYVASLVLMAIIAWIYDSRTAVLAVITGILAGGVFVWLDFQGLLRQVPPPGPLLMWIFMAAYFLIMLWATTIPSRMLHRALAESEHRREEAEAAKRREQEISMHLSEQQKELREKQQAFSAIVETSQDWIWAIDLTGKHVYSNPAIEIILGYTPKEFQGRGMELMHPDDRRAMELKWKECAEQRQGWKNLVARWQSKDGSYRFLESTAVPMLGSEGELLGFRGVDRDITERARLQEQLQQAMKMEAVGRLAGGLAHDFNNLLTAIIGNVELARDELDPSDPLSHYIDSIDTAAESAATLTRQLLAFSRIQVVEPRVIDLNEKVRQTKQLLVRLIGEDITFHTELDENAKPVEIDPGMLEQVLVNLSVNARDAMPNGGNLVIRTRNTVLTKAQCDSHPDLQPGEFVLLSVSDTGHGITEDVKRHIFEPFFTTKPMERGTGLGLATTFGTIKQAGGIIEVDSSPEIGTTFNIYLPVSTKQTVDAPKTKRSPALPGGKETILLVEDDRNVREVAQMFLERLGYRVLRASNGDDALKLAGSADEKRIDLLMTDVVMPGMNGRELSRQLLHRHPETKVLFTSGYAEDVITRHGIVQENLNFIAKPYSLQSLAHTIREILQPQ